MAANDDLEYGWVRVKHLRAPVIKQALWSQRQSDTDAQLLTDEEFFELEDRVDAPFPEPGAPLRRAGLVATGRHVKAMNWRDADDIKLRPTMELAPFPHADETFVFAPRNPLPEGEAVGALSERERRFRERAHRALQAGGAAATMGAGTDARLHEVRFAEDGGGGGGAFVRFVVAANEVVGVPCVGP